VLVPPKKRKDEYYTVMFDDDEAEGENGREVSAQYVAPYPGVWTEEGWR